MAKHTITLSPEQSSRVDVLVAAGRFATPDEAVERLLACILDDAEVSQYPPETLAHLRLGMAEADRGEFLSPNELAAIFGQLRGQQ